MLRALLQRLRKRAGTDSPPDSPRPSVPRPAAKPAKPPRASKLFAAPRFDPAAPLPYAVREYNDVPALMVIFVRGRIIPEERNPINRFLIWVYRPIIHAVLKAKTLTIAVAAAILAVSVWPATKLGSEFMPNLNEGTLFYMPVSLPGLSITKAAELLQTQDRIIKSFPEVASVFGKAGRAATATDPAPTEMFETIINLKPEEEWRPGMTTDKLISEMDKALQFPGVSNAWTMPIKARIDMLATGIRTPIGVKVFGQNLKEIERLAREIEGALRDVSGTATVWAELLRCKAQERRLDDDALDIGDGFFSSSDGICLSWRYRAGNSLQESRMRLLRLVRGLPAVERIQGDRDRASQHDAHQAEVRGAGGP